MGAMKCPKCGGDMRLIDLLLSRQWHCDVCEKALEELKEIKKDYEKEQAYTEDDLFELEITEKIWPPFDLTDTKSISYDEDGYVLEPWSQLELF